MAFLIDTNQRGVLAEPANPLRPAHCSEESREIDKSASQAVAPRAHSSLRRCKCVCPLYSRAGLHPKIETRKLGTLFIEWKGVEVVWQTPCLYQGVQGGRGAADRQRGERDRAARRVRYQTQRVVPLARCLSQGWRGWLAAAGGPAAGSREPAAAGCQPGGGGRTTRRGVGTQDRAAIAGSGFFAKSLQACRGVAPEEHRNWRDSIYGEIRSMMH